MSIKSIKRHEIYLKGMNITTLCESIGKMCVEVWGKKHELRIVVLTPNKIAFEEFVVM